MGIPIAGLLSLGGKLIDRLIPDPKARDAAKLELMKMDEEGELSRLQTQAGIITAEAMGESWLQRNWRPLTMVWFAVLVGMYWFGYTPDNLTDAALEDIFDLIKLGLTGYVVGRSAEKGIKLWKEK